MVKTQRKPELVTMPLQTFAKKLGFKRASDINLRRLLRRFSADGSLIVFQGGYRGHSTCHPKKVKLKKPLEYYVIPATKQIKDITEARLLMENHRFKVSIVKSGFDCLTCKRKVKSNLLAGTKYDLGSEFYAYKSLIFHLKLCEDCVFELINGKKLELFFRVKLIT